eukprot:TRINITY_DN1180_c0_g1_i22.p1 TRINITY_DN1180_c0_g1~~TRINITY_DN1180_c0_g1_i22.p1  ORF type:complete len:360 (+),score=44.92 TRINITY_DN1180_c0_g1_i22:288-1367(+)
MARVQRRALRQVWRGRLSAAARTRQGAPVAPHTAAVLRAGQRLFLRATPELAATATVVSEFGSELSVAAAHGRTTGLLQSLSAATIVTTIWSATRGSAPGPSGLRKEHLWAFGGGWTRRAGGCDAAAGVRRRHVGGSGGGEQRSAGSGALLAHQSGRTRCRRGALSPANLHAGDTPQTGRRSAGAGAPDLRASAAALMAPQQLVIGVPNACKRLLPALEAQLEAALAEGVLLLVSKNAFNLIFRAAARAFIDRAFRPLSAHEAATNGGATPAVHGWSAPRGSDEDDPGGRGNGGRQARGSGGLGEGGWDSNAPPPTLTNLALPPVRPIGCHPHPLDVCSPSSGGHSRGTLLGRFYTQQL